MHTGAVWGSIDGGLGMQFNFEGWYVSECVYLCFVCIYC